MPAAPTSPFCSRSSVNQSYRHIVDIGARGSCDDRAADGPQGVIGIVLPEDIVHGHSPCGQFPVGGSAHSPCSGEFVRITNISPFNQPRKIRNVAGGNLPYRSVCKKLSVNFLLCPTKRKRNEITACSFHVIQRRQVIILERSCDWKNACIFYKSLEHSLLSYLAVIKKYSWERLFTFQKWRSIINISCQTSLLTFSLKTKGAHSHGRSKIPGGYQAGQRI